MKVPGFRFLLTDMFEPWLAAGTSGVTYLSSGAAVSVAAAADVYPIIVVAADSYGVVRMQGTTAIRPMVHFPKAQPGDELAQRGFVSWKLYVPISPIVPRYLSPYFSLTP